MKKDFKLWHSKKDRIHNDGFRPFFKEREVWFCHLGENIGFEQDGKGKDFLRPIIVIKKFNDDLLWAIATTKKYKKERYYFRFSYNKNNENTTAILSQLRLIDSKRLKYRIGVVSDFEFFEMKKRIISFLE